MAHNPCLACNIQQGCCTRLNGLRVSESEFNRHFARFEDQLTIEREPFRGGELYRVSTRDEQPCPNWDGQCQVHATRPVDCRLFPVTLGSVLDQKALTVTLHHRTVCPQKTELLSPPHDAIAMTHAFFSEDVSPERDVKIVYESGMTRWRIFLQRVWNRMAIFAA